MINLETDQNVVCYDNCPACGNSDYADFYKSQDFPAILFPIEENKREKVRTHTLLSNCCNKCRHIFLNDVDQVFTKCIYEDYYYLYPFKDLESMQAAYREPFNEIVDSYLRKKSASLLEIGCDNIEQLGIFLEKGYECTAINPGAPSHSRARFINGFYGTEQLDEKFDYVVSRFNLEHIIKFEEFFSALANNLKSTGLAIVQVPNVEFFLEAGMLNVLAHEHSHYFCKTSLLVVVSRYGFEVEFISRKSEPSLICVFSKRDKSYNPIQKLNCSLQALANLQEVIEATDDKVVLYGAGLSLTGLLYSNKFDTKLENKLLVIDDNNLLWGRCMPNTSVKIFSPKEVELKMYPLIILMLGQQYHEIVYNRLINDGYRGEVMAIGNGGLFDYGGMIPGQ